MKNVVKILGLFFALIGVTVSGLMLFMLINHNSAITNIFTVYQLVRHESLYAEATDMDDFLESATAGLVVSLNDPYSVYLDARQTEQLQQRYRAEFGGIGVYLAQYQDGRVVIVAPIAGSPGERAGLKAGDIISMVDERSAAGLSLDEVTALVQGEANTQVTLRVFRESDSQEYEFSIVREIINIPSVSEEMLEGTNQIGYIHLSHFTQHSAQETADAVNRLFRQDMQGLIIDLRSNPGGDFNASINIANLFLDGKEIVSIENAREERVVHQASEGATSVPMVVLIDGNSASSSEILAGALQAHDRALLVGQQSFGKGLVQNVYFLRGGSSLKLTTDQYFTPDGVSINEIGIKPDYVVDNTEEEDLQLQRAIELLSQ